MAISAQLVKQLRDKTGAGMMDCKRALVESDGDFEKAIEILRKKGASVAAKRAERTASEGIILTKMTDDASKGFMVEVNCETDFVSRSETFRNFAHEMALQIAATSPLCVTEEQLPEEAIERERNVARNRAKEEGKPENILDRIVDGRLEKFKDEVVLVRQAYIRDGSKTVQDLLNETISAIGENIVVRRFTRWELGEHSQEDEEE